MIEAGLDSKQSVVYRLCRGEFIAGVRPSRL